MSTTVSTGARSQSTMSNLQSHRPPTFGLSITPYSNNVDEILKLAKTADALGLDIVGIQDHSYNASFFDIWTLISALAASTRKIRLFTDVGDLAMRAPPMLPKAAATLDLLT